MANLTATFTWTRGTYGQLRVPEGFGARTKMHRAYKHIQAVLRELEDGDEHRAPAWETGCEFDSGSRGSAVNVDIYGLDIANGQPLAVVQVREFARRCRNYYPRIRKNYFLLGRNEITNEPFAHPVPSRVIHAAIKRDGSPQSPVTAARAWIFDVPAKRLPAVIRHGDVAIIPVNRVPVDATIVSTRPVGCRVIDAHVMDADEVKLHNGRMYARHPTLRHLKQQHRDVTSDGWCRIQVGNRADFWQFAKPTAD